MARTQPKTPKIVQDLADIVSEKLGRPASIRKALNYNEWYIYDPVFSYIQRGARNAPAGYRVGYFVDMANKEIEFRLVHSPVVAKLFKENLVFSSLIKTIKQTAKFREYHALLRSSKYAYSINDSDTETFIGNNLNGFVHEIEEFDETYDFINDLFPKRENTGKGGGRAPVAGNTFYLLLADNLKQFTTTKEISSLVNASWDLFLCLYPIDPLEKRSASLARNMRNAKIVLVCEFDKIKAIPKGKINPLCRGSIQGAHIKPHQNGGSDHAVNGLWLCEYHHRMTEGKIIGKRVGNKVEVRFVDKKK